MTKKFTRLQLFCVTDGRLATSMDDVYDILNHYFDDNISTIGLPMMYEKLKQVNPTWFKKEVARLETIRARVGSNTFEALVGFIKDKCNDEIDVPQLTDEI